MVSSFGKVSVQQFKVNAHSVLLHNTFVGYIPSGLHACCRTLENSRNSTRKTRFGGSAPLG